MIRALSFGRISYPMGLHVQEFLLRRMTDDKAFNGHFLCLLEHPPTFTVGIRNDEYSDEFAQRLRLLGAEFHRIKRGGLVTFHGPGQLVVYPVFNLRKLSADGKMNGIGVKRFVELVEETVIQTLECDFGMNGVGRTQNPGVWVDGNRKVAAIGIQIRHGITSHGLALNCDTDLGWFDHIIPCGLRGKFVTSISRELGRSVSVSEAIGPICAQFERNFKAPVLLEENHQTKEFLAECFGDATIP
ncbi:hypothetical protein niasHT_015765 [Heterodera trifolii]|uniref:Octanoyl-[acyl-carrier-protein]:protein N-octanoyltransferase LIPT2, mitochondrial n=1 Tax=Heterodera trifolii TaxID=157864 RepID=A0ABD2L4L4_9BILA